MISSEFIITLGIVTALLSVWAMVRAYKEAVPIHWLFFVAFAFGGLGIASFYYELSYGLFGISDLILFSRILWTLILLTTSLLDISILVYRR